MLVDLLSSTNYVSFNIKLAEIIGLHPAIYLTELININEKAQRKNKVTNGFFIVDRKYITSRTTFSVKEQQEIESNLKTLGILLKPNNTLPEVNNVFMIDYPRLTSIMMSKDESLLKDISDLTNKNKKTKREGQVETMKKLINVSNPELQNAYLGWVEGVYANPKGFLSKKSIELFQKRIDEYSDRVLDVALKLINIATINGYRDAEWAIERYERDCQSKKLNPIKDDSREVKWGDVVR